VFAVGLTLLRCTRYRLDFHFAHPAILSSIHFEQAAVNPNVVLNMNAGGLCNTAVTTSNEAASNATVTVTGTDCDVDTYLIMLTTTDNGSPIKVIIVTLRSVIAL
jgi:hypothetical protein